MGAFFTNVQVRAGNAPLDPLLEALRAGADAEGMDEVEAEDEADRSILVLPPDEGGWVAVYDERTESQDTALLQALGTLASKALGVPAFSALVHDSDVLDLRLFEDGRCVDRYDSDPGYFGGRVTKKAKAEAAGHPERWNALLGEGHTPEELRKAWTAEDLFAERTLVNTAELVGCDPRRAAVGYRYAPEELELPEGTRTLRFRSRERPAYERLAEGAPSFELYASPLERMELAADDQLRLGFSARNAGGAGKGLSIVLWGSPLDDELIAVEHLELLVGNIRAGARHQELVPARGKGSHGGVTLTAALPEQAVPAGSASPYGRAAGGDMRAMMDALQSAIVHVNVVGRVLAAGRGELCVCFVPHENAEDGQEGTGVDLEIDPPLRRPLRFRDLPHPVSHLLRSLASNDAVNLLLVLDAERERAVPIARALIETTRDLADAAGEAHTAIYHRAPERRPGGGEGKASTLLRGKRFDKLVRAMVDEAVVTLSAYAGPTFDPESGPAMAGWAASFGTSIGGLHEELRVPALHLKCNAQALGEDRTREIVERWTHAVDAAVAEGLVLQATIYRSADGPGAAMGTTSYESACGISGDATSLRSFAERWLRVSGDERLWLGPALAARLDDAALEALAQVAEVAPASGGALRVELRRRSDMDAFEQALAELLPSAHDSQAAARVLYAAGTK